MLRTRVGYAGGTTIDPTYRRIGDHTEVFQVEYDPTVVSFEKLLEVFWDSHNPCGTVWSKQYQALLFYHDEGQRLAAEASAAAHAKRLDDVLTTRVVPLERFYMAEDYHQKYSLRRERRLVEQLKVLFPTESAFRDSPATTKLNAFFYGDLGFDDLVSQMSDLGFRVLGSGRPTGIERL